MSNLEAVLRNPAIISGFELVESDLMYNYEMVPIKRNFFMRIVAKLFRMKKEKLVDVPSKQIFLFENKIVAHPETIKRIREAVQKDYEDSVLKNSGFGV